MYWHPDDLNDDGPGIGARIRDHEQGRNYQSDPARNHDLASGTDGNSAYVAPLQYMRTRGHESSAPGGEPQAGDPVEEAIPEGEHEEER